MLTEIASATWASAALLPGIEARHFRYSRSLDPNYLAINSEITVDWIRDLRHQVWVCCFTMASTRCRWETGSGLRSCRCCGACKPEIWGAAI